MAATTAHPETRQQTLLEFTGALVTLHTCPCCLNKTSRDPADIIKEVEAGWKLKEEKKATREQTHLEKQRDEFRALVQTHIPVPKQSAKTGKWRGVEWIPKIMLETSWRIPSLAFHRIAARFEFDKAAGCDLLTFRGKTGPSDKFTFWDLLVSAFVALPEVPLLRSPSS